MAAVGFYGILGDDCSGRKLDGQRFAGVGIGFIERRAGAGHRHADTMSSREDLAQPTDVERDLGDLSRFQKNFVFVTVSITSSADVVDEQDGSAVGIDVTDSHNEIGVTSGRSYEQLRLDQTRPFERLGQRFGREGAHFRLGLKLARVRRTGKCASGNLVRVQWIRHEVDLRVVTLRGDGGETVMIRMEEVRGRLVLHWPVGRIAPNISRRIRFTHGAHGEIADRRFFLDAVRSTFQPMIEPADQMLLGVELRHFGKG